MEYYQWHNMINVSSQSHRMVYELLKVFALKHKDTRFIDLAMFFSMNIMIKLNQVFKKDLSVFTEHTMTN